MARRTPHGTISWHASHLTSMTKRTKASSFWSHFDLAHGVGIRLYTTVDGRLPSLPYSTMAKGLKYRRLRHTELSSKITPPSGVTRLLLFF